MKDLIYRSECRCGNRAPKGLVTQADSKCGDTCPGSSVNKCGGTKHTKIFRTTILGMTYNLKLHLKPIEALNCWFVSTK